MAKTSSKCLRGEFPLSSRLGGPTNTTDEQGPLQIYGKVVFLYSFRCPCVSVFPLSSRLSALHYSRRLWASGEQRGRKFDLATFSILYCYNIQLLYFLNSKELREYNICMYMHLCICIYMCERMWMCLCMCTSAQIWIYVCLYVYLCVYYTCVCMCVYVSMYICEYVCSSSHFEHKGKEAWL